MEYTIQNVKIEKIYRSDKDRDGNPLVYKKSGNPYVKVDIYIDARTIDDPEFKGKMSYFDSYNETVDWEIGKEISGTVKKNGQYFNFNMNKSTNKPLSSDMKDLQNRVLLLEKAVFGNQKADSLDFSKSEPSVAESIEFSKNIMSDQNDEVEDDDLPF